MKELISVMNTPRSALATLLVFEEAKFADVGTSRSVLPKVVTKTGEDDVSVS
jgi:hypothetical protein